MLLYMKIGCPYCEKVLSRNHEGSGADLTLKYIHVESNRKELIERGGKQQVPFLVDEENGVSMYESDDIVAYLAKRKKHAASQGGVCPV